MSHANANSIDALYAELYPSSSPEKNRLKSDAISTFDDESPLKGKHSDASSSSPALVSIGGGGGAQRKATAPTSSNNFDCDEEEAGSPTESTGGKNSGAHLLAGGSQQSAAALNTVPFPNISHPIYEHVHPHYRCTQAFRGYVCSPAPPTFTRTASIGGAGAVGDGEAERLRDLFVGHNTPQAAAVLAKDERAHTDLLRRKGAFHVVAPRRGNGCVDYTHQTSFDAAALLETLASSSSNSSAPLSSSRIDLNDANSSAGAVGGCNFLICRKCDHPVVRCEGVRWFGSKLVTSSSSSSPSSPSPLSPMLDESSEPETNLYLVVRNYYPDWSRIATASLAVGGNGSDLLTSTSSASVNAATTAAGAINVCASPPPAASTSSVKKDIDGFDDDDEEDDTLRPTAAHCGGNNKTANATTAFIMNTQGVGGGGSHSNATMTTNTPNGGGATFALLSDAKAAAYCCQCSWLTVFNTPIGGPITTTLADTALFAHTPNDPTHITKFISVMNEGKGVDYQRYRNGGGGSSSGGSSSSKRRLPLWVCKGHIQ